MQLKIDFIDSDNIYYKSNNIILCKSCHKEVASRINKIYCNTYCYINNINKTKSRQSSRIEKICIVCGKANRVIKCFKNDTRGSFCNRYCMAIHKSRTASGSFSHCKGGKREDLNNQYFRSSWEANYARYLNFLKKHSSIRDWQYEKKTFEFPVKKGTRFYTPDFWIQENKDKEYYVEVKGQMDQKSKTKLNRMKKYYPEIEIRLVQKKEMHYIYRQLNGLINFERNKEWIHQLKMMTK